MNEELRYSQKNTRRSFPPSLFLSKYGHNYGANYADFPKKSFLLSYEGQMLPADHYFMQCFFQGSQKTSLYIRTESIEISVLHLHLSLPYKLMLLSQ